MVIHTRHNEGSVVRTLLAIQDGSHKLESLLPFINFIYTSDDMRGERHRRFVAAWGAVFQGTRGWGVDLTNIVYATAWCDLLQKTGVLLQMRQVSSLNSSGNMIEMLLGFMHLIDLLPQMSLEDFKVRCRLRNMLWAVDLGTPLCLTRSRTRPHQRAS